MDAEREIVEQAPGEIPPVDRRACAQPGRPRRDEPPEDQPADLLGLYDGVALTHRESWGAPDDRRQNSAICHQPARTSATDRTARCGDVSVASRLMRHHGQVQPAPIRRYVALAVAPAGVFFLAVGHLVFGLANFQPGFPRLEGVASITAGLALLASLVIAVRSMYWALLTALT